MIYLTTHHPNLSFHIITYILFLQLYDLILKYQHIYVISISLNYGHLARAPTIYHFIRQRYNVNIV